MDSCDTETGRQRGAGAGRPPAPSDCGCAGCASLCKVVRALSWHCGGTIGAPRMRVVGSGERGSGGRQRQGAMRILGLYERSAAADGAPRPRRRGALCGVGGEGDPAPFPGAARRRLRRAYRKRASTATSGGPRLIHAINLHRAPFFFTDLRILRSKLCSKVCQTLMF